MTSGSIKQMHALGQESNGGWRNWGVTVSKREAVMVPHGSTVVGYEDLNVDLDRRKQRSVDKEEIRSGNRESKDEARSSLRYRCAVAGSYCAGVMASLTQFRAIASQSRWAEAST